MSSVFDLEELSEAPVFDNISAMMQRPMPWLDSLNPEQRQAVEHTEGPLLVLSGAGTGKTKVLTTRLAYILNTGKAQPWNCLVVTFTNRASREMKERVEGMIGAMADSVWLGTFHSVCVKILRAHAELVGLKPNFTILGEDDQKRLIKQIADAEGIDEKKYPAQAFLDKISRWKDKNLTPESIGADFKQNILTTVYQKYQKRLLELNCVDFGDILLHTCNILRTHTDILEKYQEKFRYIMVDEYQDTNVTQYLFLRLLCQKHKNLCCVGDDDQSIYSWRGAEVENILRFEKDFPDARIIRLERNYRSTDNILRAASMLISHNDSRLGKTLKVAENSPARQCLNEKIRAVTTYNGLEEAQYVTEEIERLKKAGYDYADMAVLVRTAAQTREFEERFIAEAVPYQVIGGPKFYERAEIRDLLAYLRVIAQPADDLAFERIVNKPARGVGQKALENIRASAQAQGTSLYQAAKNMAAEGAFSGKAKLEMAKLMENFEQWRKTAEAVSPNDLAAQVLEDSGYLGMLKAEKSVENEGRIENLQELINVMSDKENYPTLAVFLEHVSLVMDNDSVLDPNKVMLMTLHSAKGLEFRVVFLPGWEEGLFPHQRSLDEGGTSALEEERRLAYVALTRAKQKLYILMAFGRRMYGEYKNNTPSRFFNEIPTDCLEMINTANRSYTGGYQNFSTPKPKPQFERRYKPQRDKSSWHETSDEPAHEYSYEPAEDYAPTSQSLKGTRVFHPSFGYGYILSVEGQKCLVSFDKFGRKSIMGSYLRRA